ncbi:uncharacterized protein LOC127730143 isoform X11 [Mytilus californianus]|uniref:uncharacterized protein LOC127730143 isoform X11 n=1 Tax=Mytilus californianus TaxID=6549 RepID=UPI002245EF55|nr:uncharacterized protein LOC127730143 isoform X11 [Mytilus californianus]
MGPWVLKFMIVFSVILLECVKTDVGSGNGESLQDIGIIDIKSRYKRSSGYSKFKIGKSRRNVPLEEQLTPKNIYYNNPPESRRNVPLEDQLAPKQIYYKNQPESRRNVPLEDQLAPKQIYYKNQPESRRNVPLEDQLAPKQIYYKNQPESRRNVPLEDQLAPKQIYYKNQPESRRNVPLEDQLAPKQIYYKNQPESRRNVPLEDQLAPKQIYYKNQPESRRNVPLEDQLAPKQIYYKNQPESRRNEPLREQLAPKNIKPQESRRNKPLEEQPAPKTIKPAESLRNKPLEEQPAPKTIKPAESLRNKPLEEQPAPKTIKPAESAIGDPCITKPCANGGMCTWKRGKSPDFTCKCALGYKGKFCQESVPECDSQPCREKGSCVSTPKGFICMCTDDSHGIYCEDKTMKNKTVIFTPEEVYEAETGLGVFGGLVVVIIIILVIHFIRVNKRRENMVAQYQHLLSVEETHPPLPPGIFEVSNLLCYEFFCFACPKWSESLTKYASKEVLQKASSKMEEEPLMNRQNLPSMKKSLDSVWRGSFEEQKPKYRSTRDRPQSLVFPKQYSSTRPKSYSSLPMHMSQIEQQYSLHPLNYEQPDEIVNIEHVQSQESLLSRQSSRVLPQIQSQMSPRLRNLQSEMSPRSNRSFKKRSSIERPWGYDFDSDVIRSRRKSLRHHSPHETSSATHDEIADLYDRISHSRHEIPSQNNQYLGNVASEYRPQQFGQSLEQMESEYRRLSRRQSPNRRSSSSSNRQFMPIPPPPPPPPPPLQIPRDSGIDRKYGSSLIRRLSSKFDQGIYIPPAPNAPPVPPPPPFTIDD